MGIPWSESVDFEDRLPDECVMIEHYESLIEDLVDSKMIEDYHCLIEKIKGAIKAK